mmetsp:Transcript_119489/g.283667  ORF Transcript_119489/g.283667 Transcript_119489/m.283667 type:complete len:402 (-) Transcript_119489:1526-2731(-)
MAKCFSLKHHHILVSQLLQDRPAQGLVKALGAANKDHHVVCRRWQGLLYHLLSKLSGPALRHSFDLAAAGDHVGHPNGRNVLGVLRDSVPLWRQGLLWGPRHVKHCELLHPQRLFAQDPLVAVPDVPAALLPNVPQSAQHRRDAGAPSQRPTGARGDHGLLNQKPPLAIVELMTMRPGHHDLAAHRQLVHQICATTASIWKSAVRVLGVVADHQVHGWGHGGAHRCVRPAQHLDWLLQVQGLVPLRHVLGDVGHVDLHVLARIDAGGVTGRDLELQQEKGVVHLLLGQKLHGLLPGLQEPPRPHLHGEADAQLLQAHANDPDDDHHREFPDLRGGHQLQSLQHRRHQGPQPQRVLGKPLGADHVHHDPECPASRVGFPISTQNQPHHHPQTPQVAGMKAFG